MCELLVSVRSAAEANIALDRQVSFLDVKDPSAGSLGKAEDRTISAIARIAARRSKVIVSAAMGELREPRDPSWSPLDGVRLYKFGLSQCREWDWRERLAAWRERLRTAEKGASLVAAAYVDDHLAQAPSPSQVLNAAIDLRLPFLLLDTYDKQSGRLFKWIQTEELTALICRAHEAGVKVAVAGSVLTSDLSALTGVGADVLAVRGAVCSDTNRKSSLDPQRLDAFRSALREHVAATSH